MDQAKRSIVCTEDVDGTKYHCRVKFARFVVPGAQSTLWSVGDICDKEFDPHPDEDTLAELLHRILKRINKDPNERPPIQLVSQALSRLVWTAVGFGSIEQARERGSNPPDLDGMHAQGQQRLLDAAVAFLSALQQLGEDSPRYSIGLEAQTPDGSNDMLVCYLPKAESPAPPAGQAN